MSDQDLTPRVAELETLFMHLQKTVHELDQVTISRENKVDRLEQKFRRLEDRISAVEHMIDQSLGPPSDEKPPHY